MASVDVQTAPSGHSTTFSPVPAALKRPTESHSKHDATTTLNYYLDPGDGSEPEPAYVNKPQTHERPSAPLDVTVHDIRGAEDQFTLDKQGFQLYQFPSTEKDFLNDDQIREQYYPETERLLKEATGASRIFIFDHTVRRTVQGNQDGGDAAEKRVQRGPVTRVHIDQSYTAAKSRVPFHLPEDADRLLKTRYQIINVWRPIRPIYKDPLAVADARSVPESDLVPVGLIYPDRRGETYTVRPNKEHRWYFAYGQKPEEVLLIKCFDSKLDGRARRVPHTAFVNPATVDRESRESIEIRALVFHEDQSAE